jgi:hypothetical protein
MINELEVEAGPSARWQVHWCDPQRKVSWYAADPVLAVLPTLTEWAHAHGRQLGQPVLLRGREGAELLGELRRAVRQRCCAREAGARG